MGEIAEMMLDGTLCEGCGEFIGDGSGFPRYCAGCRPSRQQQVVRRRSTREPQRPAQPLSPKLYKLLDTVRLFSHSDGGGMYVGMRIDQMTRRMDQLVRFGWARIEVPHNPVHKDRLVITDAGLAALAEWQDGRHA